MTHRLEMSSKSGDRRSGGGSSRDPSTDSIDLTAIQHAGRTHALDPAQPGAAPAASEVEANVILIAHPENKMLGMRFRLSTGASVEIGRSPSCDISLPEVLSVSRSHARLTYGSDGVLLEDLHSTNGTSLNDRPVGEPVKLRHGDRFQVGAVHFKFVQEKDVEHAYHEAIYDLVMRDGLTEIFNKRKYDEEAQRECARAHRHKRDLTLMLFDIDLFKNINDSYGHLCGDFVLKHLARLTRDFLRPEQVFARVGGEEFAVLSPETDLDGAVAMAEKLRQRIEETDFTYAGFRVPVTCSFGVAQLDHAAPSPAALYDAADRALYLAKNSGRNRVSRQNGHDTPPEAPTAPPVE